jgi:hypothetical protein
MSSTSRSSTLRGPSEYDYQVPFRFTGTINKVTAS